MNTLAVLAIGEGGGWSQLRGFLSFLLMSPESSAYRSRDIIPLIKVCVPAANSLVQICGDWRTTAYCLPIEKPPSTATKQVKIITKSFYIFKRYV